MAYKTTYIHTRCGGEVDTRFFGGRRCLKCKKKWGLVSFLFTLLEIRPIKVKVPYEPGSKKILAPKWARKVGIDWTVESLPAWPRWVRVLVTFGLVVLVVALVILAIEVW